jgi:hypothetical protein
VELHDHVKPIQISVTAEFIGNEQTPEEAVMPVARDVLTDQVHLLTVSMELKSHTPI